MQLRIIFLLSLSFYASIDVKAQFIGGDADGYGGSTFTNTISIYVGGFEDGYGAEGYQNPSNIYAGGNKDGFSKASYKNPVSIFRGNTNDGHSFSSYNNPESIFSGGAKDGYAYADEIFSFIWTGNVGTGWNVAGNWSTGIIPNINSSVVIPPGAINFPAINAGLMRVGQNPNLMGNYLCKQLTIRKGAEMTLRVNAFLENYRTIEIFGFMHVLNTSNNSVRNLNGGNITIKKSGQLAFSN